MKLHTGDWCGVMLHHTATDSKKTVNDIRHIHKSQGWADVGYHYLLQKDTQGIYHLKVGRNIKFQGAHCDVKDYNNKYIGLAIIGNYEKEILTDRNYEILKSSIKHLQEKFNAPKLLFHKDVKATACPGKNISIYKLI